MPPQPSSSSSSHDEDSTTHSRHTIVPMTNVTSYDTQTETTEPTNTTANPSLFSKPFQQYSPEVKYTFYSTKTDIRQAWNLSSLLHLGESMDDLFFSTNSRDSFWLDIVAPSVEDLTTIGKTFGIHPLSIEDIQMADNREKCEFFERYLFICTRTCDQPRNSRIGSAIGKVVDGRALEHDKNIPVTLYMLVFKNFIITLHHEGMPHPRRVLRRMYSLQVTGFELTGDWVMYTLLDDIVDEFQPHLSTLQLEVDTIDELVLFLTHIEQSDMLRRIGRARKRVTHLLRLLKPKTDILKVLTKRAPEYLTAHTLIYMRDVSDHVLTNVQNLEQYSETLNRSHSNYLAQISIELNEASNRMNIVMKKLTAAAALVLPLSLISGIWGMNVPVPGQVGVEGFLPLFPFFAIVTFMIMIMAIMYYVGHRQDWW